MSTMRHQTATAVFVFLEKDGQYFYLRRQNTGWNDGKLVVPSGHVDQGESVKAAAVREVLEEAGVVVDEADLEFIHVQYVCDTYTNFYFKTTQFTGEPKVHEPHLASESCWLPITDIPKDAVFHVRTALAAHTRGEFFTDVADDPGDGRHD